MPGLKAIFFDNEEVCVRTDWGLVSLLSTKGLGRTGVHCHYESGSDFKRRLQCYQSGPNSPLELYGSGHPSMPSDRFWDLVLKEGYHSDPNEKRVTILKDAMRQLTREPNKDLLKLVEELKNQNVGVYMLSNAIPEITEGNQHQDYYKLFDKCFISWQTGFKKDRDEAFTEPLRGLNLKSSESGFVDDRADNCARAKSLGFTVFNYKFGMPVEQLREALITTGYIPLQDIPQVQSHL